MAKNIDALEHVETVFKKSVGFDSEKLRESVRGMVGCGEEDAPSHPDC